MIRPDNKRDRYLRDSKAVQMGNLASNLARIQSFSRNQSNQSAVLDIMKESRFFIEWMAEELKLEQLVLLRKLQRRLTRWIQAQPFWWKSPLSRQELSKEAGIWSTRILAQSGLIPL